MRTENIIKTKGKTKDKKYGNRLRFPLLEKKVRSGQMSSNVTIGHIRSS